MDTAEIMKRSLSEHKKLEGKIEVVPRCNVENHEDLSLFYTPGVASSCLEIKENPQSSFSLTRRGKTVAVITDGSAVLGLGNIGAAASMPVMEGKSALIKLFADIDAYPLALDTNDTGTLIKTIALLQSNFSAILLEDISAPRCFEIEDTLKEILDIPVFHDDQHGTAICVCAGLVNSLKITRKTFDSIKVVLNGPGAAGTAIIKMLQRMGVKDIIAVDEHGILDRNHSDSYQEHKKSLALTTNPENRSGTLADALEEADVFIGTSVPHCVTKDMIQSMNPNPIIYACANPIPEIEPNDALAAGACIVATGRSDYPNQVNNLLVFPGLLKGLLEANATALTYDMMIDTIYALASMIPDDELSPSMILPSVFDKRVIDVITNTLIESAIKNKVVR